MLKTHQGFGQNPFLQCHRSPPQNLLLRETNWISSGTYYNVTIIYFMQLKIARTKVWYWFKFFRFELDNLQTKVNVERERYQAAAQSQLSIVSAIPKLHINDRLTLSAADASYLLRYACTSMLKYLLNSL